MSEKELTVIKKTIAPIVREAETLTIKNAEDLKEGVVILSRLNQLNDKIKEEKEKVTKPLNEALKAERNRWKPIETMYDEAIDSVRTKMSVYQTALENERKEAERKIATRIGEGKGKIKFETAVNKLDALEKVEKEVATDAGLVQFRTTQTLEIVDETLIPREYLMVDESKLLAALKAGTQVLGAVLKSTQVPVNYR